MPYKKIDPQLFREMYERGDKMSVIAARFGVSVQSCKGMRRRLGLRPRPPQRVKIDIPNFRVKPGDPVRIEMSRVDGTASLANGKVATVSSVEEWGVKALTNFGSGRIRLHWSEFLPLDVTELVNPDENLMKHNGVGHRSPTGNPCPQCGGANLVRTGSCVTCRDCFYNEGCG